MNDSVLNFDKTSVYSFLEYAKTRGVDINNPAAMGQALLGFEQLRASPFTARSATGKIYDAGPWTWYSNDIISDLVKGGSPLMQWLPTRGVTHRNETISHLSWVAPQGWTTGTYAAFLNANFSALGECEFADLKPKFETCQYDIPFYCMSAKSDTFHFYPDIMGNKEFEKSPIFRLRGPNAGLPTQNDYEFGVALAALNFEQHLNYNLSLGLNTNSDIESDGLSEVIRVGYVSENIPADSEGACNFSDPLVYDGSGLTSVAAVLNVIRAMVRFQLERARQRGYAISPSDMAIGMPLAMWHALADSIPVGGLYPANPSLTTGGNTPQIAEAYRQQFATGGVGYGVMPIDGLQIPILPLDEFGSNTNGGTTVTSDILILVRRAGGMVLLEQQYLDYSAYPVLPDIPFQPQYQVAQSGIMRLIAQKYNESCYVWNVEACNRLVSFMQPLQGRITSVTVPVTSPFKVETGFYVNVNTFYGNGGATLGAGV